MKNKKNLFLTMILCSPFLFTSCLYFNLGDPFTVEKIEYIDDTHFEIYCTGYGENNSFDLPNKKYIIVSDEYSNNPKITHKVIKAESVIPLFISFGVIAICEVDPPFKQGEKVVVWLDSPLEDTYGYAEFVVP